MPAILRRFMLIAAAALLAAATPSRAAELVMFEQAGCEWCARFDREIAPVYPKTAEGKRAPLRRVNIDAPIPAELAFIPVERLTPLFVLIDSGREVGRIRGYPGDDHFWGLLDALVQKLDGSPRGSNVVRDGAVVAGAGSQLSATVSGLYE